MKKIGRDKIKLSKIKHIENSRMRGDDDVSDLMQDIEYRGLLEPIGVRKEDNALIFGNRRVKAFEKLGYDEIDCDFFTDVSDEDLLFMNLAENLKRRSIGSIEIGRVCKILIERGMTNSEIAVKLGISKGRVQACISAFNVTVGTPFETIVMNGKDTIGAKHKGIPDGLIWRVQTGLSRVLGGKITKNEWNILLRLMEEGKLHSKNLSILRAVLMSSTDKNLIKAVDILGKCTVIYPSIAFNEAELMKALRKEKVSNGTELMRMLLKRYNKELIF